MKLLLLTEEALRILNESLILAQTGLEQRQIYNTCQGNYISAIHDIEAITILEDLKNKINGQENIHV